MDNDLNRSLRILEGALTPQGRGLIKLNTSQSIREKRGEKGRESSLIPLIRDTASEISLHASLRDQNKTITGSVIRTVEPWKNAIDNLYIEFLEILQSHVNEHDVLQVISDLARCCSDAVKVVDELKSKVAITLTDEDKWLEIERNTWRLIYILYQDRLTSQNNIEDIVQYFGSSEKLCVLNLFKRESLIRESQLVIDWLEYSAAEKDDQVLHFSDRTVGWENTLHQLESAETIVFASQREIVKKLDPDAQYYQGLPLHDLDVDDEKALHHNVFREIRCGKLKEAQKLCVQCGHPWRAALLEGWRLFHDPNLEHENNLPENDPDMSQESSRIIIAATEHKIEETEGNVYRDDWKLMAFNYCQQSYLNVYEKASVAAYCGYLKPLLAVSNDWEDTLWAHMKVMVDVRVESEVRDYVNRNYKPLSDIYWDQKMSLNDVFASIESSNNVNVQKEARDPHHIIQKHIILDEIPELLLKLEEWIKGADVTAHFKRFAAHLVLFLEQIGQAYRKDVEPIVEAYVRQLMDMNETQLVAYYTSKLNSENQVRLCALYFERIINNDERREALQIAESCGLNTHAIIKQVVENIRGRYSAAKDVHTFREKLTEEDELKISALDWLFFYDSQRHEALYQTNALIFTFLMLGKLDAAQLAFNKIASDSVETILAEGEPSQEIDQIIKEHLSYKAYLDAHEAFNIWFKQYSSRPQPPENVPENAHYTEKVAYQHRMSRFNAETELWKMTTAQYAKAAKTMLYNVLLFPDGGWLTGAKDGDYLRSVCIPEVVLLLYSVLSESELHAECVQLADILAAEKYGLYKVYPKEKLQELVMKLCDSSVALLHQNKDPWGSD